jgi:hypothetical protein
MAAIHALSWGEWTAKWFQTLVFLVVLYAVPRVVASLFKANKLSLTTTKGSSTSPLVQPGVKGSAVDEKVSTKAPLTNLIPTDQPRKEISEALKPSAQSDGTQKMNKQASNAPVSKVIADRPPAPVVKAVETGSKQSRRPLLRILLRLSQKTQGRQSSRPLPQEQRRSRYRPV